MKSEFSDWFKQQHGPRESGLLSGYSDLRLRDEIQRGKMAESELAARALWDDKRQSALYAWKASRQK